MRKPSVKSGPGWAGLVLMQEPSVKSSSRLDWVVEVLDDF